MAQLSKENKLMRGFRDAAAMTPEEKESVRARRIGGMRNSFVRAAPWAGMQALPATAVSAEPPSQVVSAAETQPSAASPFSLPSAQASTQMAKVPPGFVGSLRQQRGQVQPDGSRMVIDQRPLAPQSVSFAPAPPEHNFIRDEATGSTVSLASNRYPRWTDRAGNQIERPVSATAPAPSNGIRRVGNMDVAFDSSVSPEARQRFMEQPVAPTGQMRQYENYMNTPRGQNFGVRPLNQDQSGLLTRENAPAGMGWQERKAINEQMLQNRQSGINAELQADVTREGLRPTAQEQAQTEVAQIGLRSAQRIETALRDYETADTPEKKAAALERYRLLTKTKEPTESKPEIRTEEVVENGVVRARTVAITTDKDGNVTKREVPEAGQAASLPPVESREVGKVYTMPQGKFKWTAEGWEKV